MKKNILIKGLIIGMLQISHASACDSVSFSYGGGERPKGLKVYRFGLQHDWHKQWLSTRYTYLDGYWDLNATYMHARAGRNPHSKTNQQVLSLMPMFRLKMNPFANTIAPFIEAGIGPALLKNVYFGNLNISTSFQFDDRLGIGFQFGRQQQFELGYMYNHLSNAGIKKPNPGIDASSVVTLRYHFS